MNRVFRSQRTLSFISLTTSLLVGLAAFFIIFGGLKFLDPSNVTFLVGDSKAHYVSQLFFLSDSWRFPLGLNPNYGQEFSFTSSINGPGPFPLLFFQKLFGLSPELQLYGLLTWFNLTLHHQLGTRILRRFDFSYISQHLFSLFFLTPFLLFRLEIHPFSVAIQWPILWAILILLKSQMQERVKFIEVFWLVFFSYSIFVNLWFIVTCILLYQITQIKTRNLNWKEKVCVRLSTMYPIVGGTLVASCIIDGMFLLEANLENGMERFRTEGWGVYSYNLLSLINPDTGIRDEWYFKPGVGNVEGWSYNMSTTGITFGMTYGSYEGFSYIGLGAIAVGLVALLHFREKLQILIKARVTSLSFVYSLVLVTYAVAPTRISVGSIDIRIVPSYIINLVQPLFPFRSSGRLFTFFAYLLILVSIVAIRKAFPEKAFKVLLLCLAIQFIDLSVPLAERFSFAKVLVQKNLDWREDVPMELILMSREKRELRTFPVRNAGDGYDQLAWWAWQLEMSTNSVYSSRPNQGLLASVSKAERERICSNRISKNTVYAIQKSEFGTGELRNCNLKVYATASIDDWLFITKQTKKAD